MKRIYVTGTSGTGKSTISKELNKRGIISIDISIKNTELNCYWQNNKTKERVEYKQGFGIDWFKNKGRVCDSEVLKNYLDNHKEVKVVTGMASNQDEYLYLFDKVILLQCKKETFLLRMKNRDTNNFGKNSIERQLVLESYKNFESNLLTKGAIPIDNNGDISEVVDKIVLMLNE